MEKFGKSQPVKRVEDVRFLTGQGRYVDDIAPEASLHGFVFRSPVAHGAITALDVSEARAAEGVHLVLTCADLEEAGLSIAMTASRIQNRDGSKGAKDVRPILAKDKLRFVGEPVAMIIADTLQQARDAAELITLDYDDLPAKLDLAPGGAAVHDVAPDNVVFDFGLGDEAATQAAFEAAAHVVSMDVEDNRIICNAMETRGCYAEMDAGRLHFAFNGQGVWGAKGELAKALDIPADQIRVTNPDVGGGFGMKAFMYPEYFCVAQAARTLGRPVRWMSERTEAMLTDNAGRDLTTRAELAFDADHKLTGYRLHTRANMGAYCSGFAQNIQTELFSKVLTGVYHIPAAYMRAEGFFTNTTQVDAYRGAGRPEAIYVLERVMDRAARELGLDPWELRQRNFIRPDQFPYTTPSGVTYDIGDFNAVLSHVGQKADRDGFAGRKAASEAAGKLRGQGLCYYIESILGDPSETSRVVFEEDGSVALYVGTQSNGQGHETVFAAYLADQTGIPMEAIHVVQGDSDAIPSGGGTGGSRSATVQSTATLKTVETMIAQFTPFLADIMGVEEDKVNFDHETFRAEGSNMTPTMLEVAELAREHGREDLLDTSETITLDSRSFPNGAHVAEVEIDPETGIVRVDRYEVVDDFGNLLNPMLVEGQIHGGVAQGIGQALTERVVFDEDGQLLTATFMDYAMPRADIMPMIGFATEPTASKYNPLGMKGCGEAGTVGALAAVSNAVQDALWARGVTQVDMPFTPEKVWRYLEDAPKAAE
ncbi:xanthine dehydrogenase family protein molybdopterin-binding subunit [Primorskyibacter sp. S187A]|uniref:xanthine dehydrogenase family protein molybdopterin-binding subunit n=1 Tax=Primorskyibacter sp. S187A TaxID=3415130 RepID=UPI003C7E37C7